MCSDLLIRLVLTVQQTDVSRIIHYLHARHEIVGIVKEVGSNVHRFKAGDHVGVGTFINSCRECEYCIDEIEVHCEKGVVSTFNGIDADGTVTKGGYSNYIVVHERQVFYDIVPLGMKCSITENNLIASSLL